MEGSLRNEANGDRHLSKEPRATIRDIDCPLACPLTFQETVVKSFHSTKGGTLWDM